jgi:hypothetical protein
MLYFHYATNIDATCSLRLLEISKEKCIYINVTILLLKTIGLTFQVHNFAEQQPFQSFHPLLRPITFTTYTSPSKTGTSMSGPTVAASASSLLGP